MSTQTHKPCFLLTHSSRDINGHFEMLMYGVASDGTGVKLIIDTFRPLFFVPRTTPTVLTTYAAERKSIPLKHLDGTDVDCLYFNTYSSLLNTARSLREKAIRCYESDVYPADRYLMERKVRGGFCVEGNAEEHEGLQVYRNPRVRGVECVALLNVLSLDIETNAATDELYSIASSGKSDVVFIIGNGVDSKPIVYCRDERELVQRFLAHLHKENPDVLIGWNVINFDLNILQKRCQVRAVPFDIGRDAGSAIVAQKENSRQYNAKIPGRVVLDIPVVLRAQNHIFESYSLENVASQVLGRGKRIEETGVEKINEINRLFHEDKAALAAYNLEDTILTKEIMISLNLLENAIERTKLSGLLLDHFGGSVAAFDYLYLPHLHRMGYVASNTADIAAPIMPLTGGHVMESRPGIYENVLLLDFKSLYPTIIMTFCVDPLGAAIKTDKFLTGPTGMTFSRDKAILPDIIAELLDARAEAKKTGNAALSYAIKILMNSFYGVLGSSGCRFFSPDIAQAITGTGQYIFKSTCSYIEKTSGFSVIYGDTDSLFVLLGPGYESQAQQIGITITNNVNTWLKDHLKTQFNADSALELQFETHFRNFFMPTIRGSSQGSKKRYCGTVEKNGVLTLHFKGLESARSDWTPLAKEFQRALFTKVFAHEPVESYIIATVNAVKQGKVDDKLVYQKQLRKPVNEYTVNIPPHAQAAKMLDNPGHSIRYFITTSGPQPAEKLTSPLDYQHYIEAQLRPVADAILEWIHLDFEKIISGQQDLFGV